MPVHDWTRVSDGTFRHFHHAWIGEIADVLNDSLLPSGYYAMAEPFPAGSSPGLALAKIELQPTGETDLAFYRRKQNAVAVRNATGDRVVAVVEIVSRGNKSAREPLEAFVKKAATLLEKGVHLLIIDLHPPRRRDPAGIHNEIWQAIAGEKYVPPPDKPLTLASYESGVGLGTYVVGVAVGDVLPDMPLFLQPGHGVYLPLEKTYNAAVAKVPQRWRRVLEDTDWH